MRLIDADALKEELNSLAVDLTKSKFPHYIKDDADYIIDTAPTVDAVPVVRCKDCKWKGITIGESWCDFHEFTILSDDDFCSYGERKDDDTERG